MTEFALWIHDRESGEQVCVFDPKSSAICGKKQRECISDRLIIKRKFCYSSHGAYYEMWWDSFFVTLVPAANVDDEGEEMDYNE